MFQQISVSFTRRSTAVVAAAAMSLLAGLTACDDKAADGSKGEDAKGSAQAKGDTKPAKGKPKQNRVASCQRKKTDGYCTQWGEDNIDAAGMEHLETMCKGLGTFAKSACPTDGALGTCTTPEGMKVFYSGGPLELKAADAEKQCKQGIPAGTWKAQ